ncbi:bifunctional diguanylate cyclase/phosphodiesterase [Sulfurimonas sp.]|jgi:diguanylate cyclase (GGDEF)-like protein|uniref:bifunctional diguanylate cyclase/phosphodiesterase n=1 Tax=Sulfurimonas sp. TaxID=2022749 RepID=UPI0025D67B17|nr:bifunctional diguanylate cyclase/phosphodiesterase [Sulfurimonas sp.]MBT5934881.1 bifunctional diguanylate cyclase/phosphodiesterase [Sulfurimonas sp.]
MRFIVHYGRTFTILLFLFPLLGLSASYLYTQFADTKKEIIKIVQQSMLDKKDELLSIYTDYLTDEFGSDYIKVLKDNTSLRRKAETSLSLIKDSEVQYLYLLYIDNNSKLRYLIDTTKDIDEKGEFSQRFYPQKDIWLKAASSQKSEVTAQAEIDKLWITMVFPIIRNEKTVALLGIDFSHAEYLKVNKTLIPLENIYLYSAVFIIVMLISAFLQLVIYYTHRKKSFIDPLTGMFNRQYLHELLQKYPVGDFQVLIMDLDHFKKVNDIYGHDAGDIVLSTVSARIKSAIRKQDILIRYGGEEFILLISNSENDLETSLDLANRIREAVKKEPISLDQCQLNITISMGLNPFPQDSKTFEHVVKIADLGLYQAKQLGRNRVEVYIQCLEEGNVDAQLQICDVRDALDLNKFFCVYQPIYLAKTMKIDSYELLLRMYNTSNEIINPAQFLPSVRHTQIYTHLSKRVIDFAYDTLSSKDIKISINLEVEDLFNEELIVYIIKKFDITKNLAQRLTIELLEYEETLDFSMINQRANELQSLGIKLAIDSFGSGFSSYDYLLNMNISSLKLDAKLTHNIDSNQKALKIVSSIQNLANSMKVTTVAKNIETEEELQIIKKLNIDYIQGYYLSKFIPEVSLI